MLVNARRDTLQMVPTALAKISTNARLTNISALTDAKMNLQKMEDILAIVLRVTS